MESDSTYFLADEHVIAVPPKEMTLTGNPGRCTVTGAAHGGREQLDVMRCVWTAGIHVSVVRAVLFGGPALLSLMSAAQVQQDFRGASAESGINTTT